MWLGYSVIPDLALKVMKGPRVFPPGPGLVETDIKDRIENAVAEMVKTGRIRYRELVRHLPRVQEFPARDPRLGRLSKDGPGQEALPDLEFVASTINDMGEEYIRLIHALEVKDLERLKYHGEYPNMVTNFRKNLKRKELKCRAQCLSKLKGALRDTKGTSAKLASRKRYLRLLRDDNLRLQGLVEEVAKETEAITNKVLTYYNRRAENTRAIARANESALATRERIAQIELNNAAELEEWQDEDYELRRKHYQLHLVHEKYDNDRLCDLESLRSYAQQESMMLLELSDVTGKLENFQDRYKVSLGVIYTQRKVNAAAHKDIDAEEEAPFTMEDVKKWASQLQNPETFREPDVIKEAVNEEPPEKTAEDMALEREEEEEFGRRETVEKIYGDKRGMFSSAPLAPDKIRKNMNNDEAKEWDDMLGSLQGAADLQQKLTAVVNQEEVLGAETEKKKRVSEVKTKKVDRLKHHVQQLHDETRTLQQNCDNLFNKINDAVDDQITVAEHTVTEVERMTVSIQEENEQTEDFKEQYRQIDKALQKLVVRTNAEIEDITDESDALRDEAEQAKDAETREQQREILTKSEIEHGRAVRVQQDRIRRELAAELKDLTSRVRVLDAEYARISDILETEETICDDLYRHYTAPHSAMATLCREVKTFIKEAKIGLDNWRAQTATAKASNEQVKRNFGLASLKAEQFTDYLREDLTEMKKSDWAYKILSQICEDYAGYANEQTDTAEVAVNDLREAIIRVANERPSTESRLKEKRHAAQKAIEKLLIDGPSADPEYKACSSFLRQTQKYLKDLLQLSGQATQFLDLTVVQCQKLYDMGDRFACYILRKQPVYDLPTSLLPVIHPSKGKMH